MGRSGKATTCAEEAIAERDRGRIRYDFIMRQRSRERRHAVRDNKCFPIIQPQNSYLEKGRKGRDDDGVAAGDAQWRVETAEGLV